MSDIFTCSRGTVVVLEGCKGIPSKLILDGFEPQAAIIVGPSISQQANVQFQTSLKEAVYAYVFGDMMGTVELTGVAFAGRCNNESASGVKDVFDYYKDYRASKRTDVVTVTLGSEAMSGFLTAMSMRLRDPSELTMDFGLRLNTLPKKGG